MVIHVPLRRHVSKPLDLVHPELILKDLLYENKLQYVASVGGGYNNNKKQQKFYLLLKRYNKIRRFEQRPFVGN